MSEAKHTPGPWRLEADPCHFDSLTTVTGGQRMNEKTHAWPAYQLTVQVGGTATMKEAQANARHIVACVNACDGLDTELLENITTMGDTLASRFKMRDQVERELEAQRDELLAALKGMLEVFGDEFGIGDSSVCDDARAAIAKATNQ